jgi:hypothetical protein
VAFAGVFFLVESGQGPFDNRRQKAWLLPGCSFWSKAAKALSTIAVKGVAFAGYSLARYLLLCRSSAAGRVKLSKWN